MRFAVACFTLAVVSCGSDGKPATSGPIERIVVETPTATRLEATRHKLDLAALPLSEWIGLPVRGTIEVNADVTIPRDGIRDYPHAYGSISVRCLDTCTIGDDVTRLHLTPRRPADDAFLADGIPFSHIDISALELSVIIDDGTARLDRFHLGSPDLDVALSFHLALADKLSASHVDACLHIRPTDALRSRDPRLHDLITLASPTRSDDNFHHITFAGSLAEPRIMGKLCAVTK